MKDRIAEFFSALGSAIIAILRLFFLTLAFLSSGLHIVLFNRTEVCNAELRGLPWRCDREKTAEKMAFIDRLYIDNPDLFEPVDEQDHTNPEDTDDGEDYGV